MRPENQRGSALAATDVVAAPPLGWLTYVASGMINLLALALPLTILQIYDRVLPNASFDTLTALVALLGAVVVLDGILKYCRASVINWGGASFIHTRTMLALDRMLGMRPGRFSQTRTSEHLDRINAISAYGRHLGGPTRVAAVDILFIPIFASIILVVGGMVFISVVSLFCLFSYLTLRRTQALNDAIRERESHEARKQDFIIEVLQAIQTVKSLAMEPLIMRRYERLQATSSLITKKVIRLTGTAQTYSAAYASLSVIMVVSVGAFLVLEGRLTLGALACCMLLSSQLLQPLMRSLASWNEIQMARHQRGKVSAIFEDDAETGEVACPMPSHVPCLGPLPIIFREATIQSADGSTAFESLCATLNAGKIIALRGTDNSGRTTLLRSIIGDGIVSGGEIFVGEIPSAQARSVTCYVGANPVLFRGTILENLTLFGDIPSPAALATAQSIGLEEEVARLPLGWDTMVKSTLCREVPVAIAQRIAIARALALEPSVLIFDEANTTLDHRGEASFAKMLEDRRGDATVLIATHRPSLLSLADEVYDVGQGTLTRASASQKLEGAA